MSLLVVKPVAVLSL